MDEEICPQAVFLLLGKDTMFRNLLSMQPGKKSEAIKQDPAF